MLLDVSQTVVLSALADPASRARRPAEAARTVEEEGRIVFFFYYQGREVDDVEKSSPLLGFRFNGVEL